MPSKKTSSVRGSSAEIFAPASAAIEYGIDLMQRTVLFWDVMRQRGNAYHEHLAEKAPNVLDYEAELVVAGWTLDRPVNYGLVRIIPPAGIKIDPRLRPFVVIDPRAGHGPGIGGFKADSEIGVVLKAGHPCYFAGFLPEPIPGQTIEDVARAEAVFLAKVIELHPEADGKPCVIGNCQAGWAVMLLAAVWPELFGPIIIAGSPLSYWTGVHGQNPMRYTGGLLGGSWLTALTSDLGQGKFDGAWLVQNFENLDPANTLWSKQYHLFANIDTEAERYLKFERWWGGHVNLNAEEIQSIVDNLFIGNKLASGDIQSSDGAEIDLRNIHSPIVVFCSKADNITPPQQALGWILELYDNVDDIRACGQTIVYTVHESLGHLGIFVSTSAARKEHGEFAGNIDLIDVLPPGLYEAIFVAKTEATANPDLTSGDWVMQCEPRTLDDIRALGGNDVADNRCFAAAARVSEMNLALYRTFAQPMVQALIGPFAAQWVRELHPLRLRYDFVSDKNRLMATLGPLAQWVREHRLPVAEDNPFVAAREAMSRQIVAALDAWRDLRDAIAERTFFSIYGIPALQASLGIDPATTQPMRRAGKSTLHRELLQAAIADLKSRIPVGGLREGIVRALLYIGMARGTVDERGFEMVRRIRGAADEASRLPLDAFKVLVREQFYMLLLDQEAALSTLPDLFPQEGEVRRKALDLIRQVLSASGEISGEVEIRLRGVERLLGVEDRSRDAAKIAILPAKKASPRAKAS